MSLAVIPARGGSKRISRKNIRKFAGKPIIAYSIHAALASKLFNRVIVSTEDTEIAEVARAWGAETPFIRPIELADDYTGTSEVIKHAVQWFMENDNVPDQVCCIYATAPLLQAHYLIEGYERLIATGKSYAFSVTSFPFPIQRALRINSEGAVEAINPEHIFSRSQDLEETFHDAGQFYWARVTAILNDTITFSPASVPVILPRHLVQDIDTP